MKNGACPKCESTATYVIETATVTDHQSTGSVKRATLVTHGGTRLDSSFDNDVRNCVYVCASCGFSEIYGKDLDALARLVIAGEGMVRLQSAGAMKSGAASARKVYDAETIHYDDRMWEVLIGVGVAVGVAAVPLYRLVRGFHDTQSRLEQIARLHFDSGWLLNNHTLSGTRNGVRVIYRLHDRPRDFADVMLSDGPQSDPWTEIDVELPAKYPLVVEVRRRTADPPIAHLRWVADGLVIDGAPMDVVRVLLGDTARSFLARFDPVELHTTGEDRLALRFALPGYWMDPKHAVILIDQVTQIAAGTRAAYAEAEAAVPRREVGAPFRAENDAQPERAAAAARAQEIAMLAPILAKHRKARHRK